MRVTTWKVEAFLDLDSGREKYALETKYQDIEPRTLTLEELQAAVGGYIERMPMPEAFDGNLYVNEEGRNLGLPFNPGASEFVKEQWLKVCAPEKLSFDHMMIFGDAILIQGEPNDE